MEDYWMIHPDTWSEFNVLVSCFVAGTLILWVARSWKD